MPDEQVNSIRQQDIPVTADLSSSKTEQIHELVNFLVKNYQDTSESRLDSDKRIGGHDLKVYGDWLEKAHTYFREASTRDLTLTLAAEWVLDNYYIIRQALLQISEDLPFSYYKQLPKLARGQLKGLPRIYAIAGAVLSFQNYLLNTIDLQIILTQVQESIPLAMGELWALPIFLRYNLIEALAHELESLIHPQPFPALPVHPQHFTSSGHLDNASQAPSGETFSGAVVANIILSLRSISEQDWNDFFEATSSQERLLREDPAGIYPQMDFRTRDLYRKEVEALSLASGQEENQIIRTTIDLAHKRTIAQSESAQSPLSTEQSESFADQFSHVGEYLLGRSRPLLEHRIGYRPNSKAALFRWADQHSSPLYLGGIFFISLLTLWLISPFINLSETIRSGSTIQSIALILVSIAILVAALVVSSSLANWLITLLVKPRILPKLNFVENIPDSSRTFVVIPALISSKREIDNLARQLEMNFLRNQERGLLFALLTDFSDADSETLPEDDEMISYAENAIQELNYKYGRPVEDCDPPDDGSIIETNETVTLVHHEPLEFQISEDRQLFYLLHRKRLWNPSEQKWMGWERKRGKLHELNRLLRGSKDTSFITMNENLPGWSQLQCVQYVITLDADTILPRRAAARLVGTLAHPLNRAKFNNAGNRVISGYTVLQPRMEIHPRSANYSWFTRIFAGDTGLDLYTRAISDAYQDLFGEGSYVGKGIYDVDAFERSVDEHIPENRVLSHDLLEGIMGRAGLVTDVTMIEDYPLNYYVQVMRQIRWMRGDWQLLPWLFNSRKFGVKFKAIDQWKLVHNLLRSLLTPSLMVIFILGIILHPHLAWLWITIVLLSLGIPTLTSMARSAMQTLGGESISVAFHPLKWSLVRWLLAVVYLPHDAYYAMGAILITLGRLFFTHRNLLQWTTAAQASRSFGLQVHRTTTWVKVVGAILLSVLFFILLQLTNPVTGSSNLTQAFLIAAPILLLWILSPLIDQQISLPIKPHTIPLDDEQVNLLRLVARRTWGFFERFVGPEDHWLPPDHYQEFPVGIIAHRTSPTNIGLLFTSTLSAYDLGYLDQLGLSTRLAITMDTMDGLERFRGHFFNWYDTLTLQPLNPRYISTIDSGNLAACLIVTAQACLNLRKDRIFRWTLWQGYLDTLSTLTEIIKTMRKTEFDHQVGEINQRISKIHNDILMVQTDPNQWYALFQTINGQFWPDLSNRLIELVSVGREAFDLEALRKLQEVASQVGRHHETVQRTLSDLVPWIELLEHLPPVLAETRFKPELTNLKSNLPYNPRLGQIHTHITAAQANIEELRKLLTEPLHDTNRHHESGPEVLHWLDALERALVHADANAGALIDSFTRSASRAELFVNAMDFRFLYHPQRRVFHNGFNLDVGQLDNNYYDLLASEARIASIVALAKGEVPQSHWLHLSRPMTRVEGVLTLLSWSATMFEYLMPPLFLRSYPGTLLADSAQGAILHQIAYGRSKAVPWGFSESGFYLFDANQNYQYRAFGAPGLGFKRGLGDDLVVSPYASIMAIKHDPHAVTRNLNNLLKYKSFGLYGMYEAIDFTTSRLPEGATSVVVCEYMAHHHGMTLMALANYFYQDIMVRRMHGDPRIQSVELLLQEQVPLSVPLQNPHAEDVRGLTRLASGPVKIDPWSVPIQTTIPLVTLLSNGNYGTLLSNMGGGYSTWRGVDLTRWHADGVLDANGTWIYVQELDSPQGEAPNPLWSTTYQPIPPHEGEMQVTFFPHMAVFRRTEYDITSTIEVTISPDDPVEIRRLHVHNSSNRPRHLRFTSYGEVILTQLAADRRHPAFNKLFIESEFVPELNLQLFWRRTRSADDKPICMGHMLVLDLQRGGDQKPPVRHEADRNRFIGRGRSFSNPLALQDGQYLTGTTGATLDPIFALGQDIYLEAHENDRLAYLTLAGESREEVLALARRYNTWSLIDRSFHQSNMAAQAWLGKQNYDSQVYKDTLHVLSALFYPSKAARASAEVVAKNRLSQSGLWRFGISGDYPIMLIEISSPRQIELVREVLQIHEFLRSRRFSTDVVIINQQRTDYGAELNGMLYRLVNRLNSEQWLTKRGGIFILYADQMGAEELTLLQTAAGFLFSGEYGTLSEHIPDFTNLPTHLPELVPTLSTQENAAIDREDPLPSLEPLQYFNGYGGFHANGKEYIIELAPGKHTPAPWINIIGYPFFGFMVSETGSQCTWAINSGENRLTPWSNDPVRDPTGEALYLRDEETGEVWSPTPLPAPSGKPYRVIHGAGYTIFEHNSHGLRQRLTLFASPEDPVKIIHLRLQNTLDHNRRITATQYIEWVLGITHTASLPFLIPEFDAEEYCLLVTNPYSAEFGERTAFLMANKGIHGLTTDRAEFLGRGGNYAAPAGLGRIGLESNLSPNEDLCAALQLHIDLLPDGVEEIYFVLGQGNNKDHAIELAKKYRESAYVGDALERTRVFWNHLLNTIQVHTPDPAADLILNHWMIYQSLSCRLWGRSAFYQPSGAFGFRDQLQDALAMLDIDASISRGQILNAAQYQFTEGDVMHWWHPPSGRGVRTRISDDLLWLPYVTAQYVETTGDESILLEKIPFLDAPPLREDEIERYNEYPRTKDVHTVMEHCNRAIERGASQGPHGLALIGTGDWNDALNKVGEGGKGESVWLAWFLIDVLERFALICDRQGEAEQAEYYRKRAKEYVSAIEETAWDGEWYRRGYYDDGYPIGSQQNSECQIDAIAQSWSVLSGSGNPERSQKAMQAVLDRLVKPEDRLSLLFAPPFDKTEHDPGYIKGYFPGIRENGGQYSHAAIWTAWAFTLLGDGKQAGELFDLLNPIFHADTAEKADEYRVEPYVICSDIYSRPPYVRRGGWTWYTGSAAWMYRLGLTAILGFKKSGNTLSIDPCIPPEWDGYEIDYKHRSASYHIEVKNPQHVARHVRSMVLDGEALPNQSIPLADDGKAHTVEVTMGENVER